MNDWNGIATGLLAGFACYAVIHWLIRGMRHDRRSRTKSIPPHKMTLVGVRVIDGDTLAADVIIEGTVRQRLPYGIEAPPASIALVNQRIRLLDFDAYEMREPGGAEAKAALERLLELSDEPPELLARGEGKKDNFGRLLGDVHIRMGGKPYDVARTLAVNGHGETSMAMLYAHDAIRGAKI